MDPIVNGAVDFYSRHPISLDIILAKLRTARGHLEGARPESCSHMTRPL
jgi:hypothetical protein